MTRPIQDPDAQPGLYRQVAQVRQRVTRLERRPGPEALVGGAGVDWVRFDHDNGAANQTIEVDPSNLPLQLTYDEASLRGTLTTATMDTDGTLNLPGPGFYYVRAWADLELLGVPYGYPHNLTGATPGSGVGQLTFTLEGPPGGREVYDRQTPWSIPASFGLDGQVEYVWPTNTGGVPMMTVSAADVFWSTGDPVAIVTRIDDYLGTHVDSAVVYTDYDGDYGSGSGVDPIDPIEVIDQYIIAFRLSDE